MKWRMEHGELKLYQGVQRVAVSRRGNVKLCSLGPALTRSLTASGSRVDVALPVARARRALAVFKWLPLPMTGPQHSQPIYRGEVVIAYIMQEPVFCSK